METENQDAFVAQRVIAGDTEAFRVLVDRYSDQLFRFCRARLGDDADAEDAVQDVFVRAFRSVRSYDPSRSWASWLFTIAANRVKSRYAARASTQALVERTAREASVVDEALEAQYDPERITMDAMAGDQVRAAVATLAPSYRAPVELYYFAGLDVAGVAEALSLGEEAVKTRLFRARKEILAWFDKKEQPTGSRRGRH
ncbi:MAG TPA: RNA polymerase sigma factor [bacterium]|nr:RNA polymerase sigma factor [bacterium]